MAGPQPKRIMAFVMLFFLVLLSYSPLVTEIDDLAANATTTNAVMMFLDSWFGLFWIILAMLFLTMAMADMMGYI